MGKQSLVDKMEKKSLVDKRVFQGVFGARPPSKARCIESPQVRRMSDRDETQRYSRNWCPGKTRYVGKSSLRGARFAIHVLKDTPRVHPCGSKWRDGDGDV